MELLGFVVVNYVVYLRLMHELSCSNDLFAVVASFWLRQSLSPLVKLHQGLIDSVSLLNACMPSYVV